MPFIPIKLSFYCTGSGSNGNGNCNGWGNNGQAIPEHIKRECGFK